MAAFGFAFDTSSLRRFSSSVSMRGSFLVFEPFEVWLLSDLREKVVLALRAWGGRSMAAGRRASVPLLSYRRCRIRWALWLWAGGNRVGGAALLPAEWGLTQNVRCAHCWASWSDVQHGRRCETSGSVCAWLAGSPGGIYGAWRECSGLVDVEMTVVGAAVAPHRQLQIEVCGSGKSEGDMQDSERQWDDGEKSL